MATTTATAQELFDQWSDPFKESNVYQVASAVLALPVGASVGGKWVPRVTVTGRSDTQVTLTGDGYWVKRTGWCQCPADVDRQDVYYEAWSQDGREAHGWCCPKCRGITQTG